MLRKERADIVWRFFGILEGGNFLREKEVAENRKNLGGSEIDVEERKGSGDGGGGSGGGGLKCQRLPFEQTPLSTFSGPMSFRNRYRMPS